VRDVSAAKGPAAEERGGERALKPRHTLSRRVLRYGVVGLVAFAIDYGVTAIAITVMLVPLLLANSLGFVVANVANFLLGHWWVFRDARGGRHWLRAYVGTLGVSVVGLLLNNAIVWLAVGLMGGPLLGGKVAATAIVMGFNFFIRHGWIYRRANLEPEKR